MLLKLEIHTFCPAHSPPPNEPRSCHAQALLLAIPQLEREVSKDSTTSTSENQDSLATSLMVPIEKSIKKWVGA
jgi:hypothetical protein